MKPKIFFEIKKIDQGKKEKMQGINIRKDEFIDVERVKRENY